MLKCCNQLQDIYNPGGSSKQHLDGLKTHTCEYFKGTRALKIKNPIIEEP